MCFRCGAKQSGELGTSSEALDGIIGFGQANSSMISQLAAAGKVKKIFAHCLDSIKGGGIFAIGEVVEPKVHTTPVVPHQYVIWLQILLLVICIHFQTVYLIINHILCLLYLRPVL